MIHSLSWRKSTERVTMAREILSHPNMSAMLAVLELDHPSKNIPAVHDGFGATEQLGIIKGYERCIRMLRDLGEAAPIPPEAITTNWGVNEPEK
jgi:hypothetical protein